ncbi:hypothetical protein DFP72DRAFT_872939, partial [Ephemerocybe angulata]
MIRRLIFLARVGYLVSKRSTAKVHCTLETTRFSTAHPITPLCRCGAGPTKISEAKNSATPGEIRLAQFLDAL